MSVPFRDSEKQLWWELPAGRAGMAECTNLSEDEAEFLGTNKRQVEVAFSDDDDDDDGSDDGLSSSDDDDDAAKMPGATTRPPHQLCSHILIPTHTGPMHCHV